MKLSSLIGCDECYYRTECGGLDGQQGLWGCMPYCRSDCVANGCDWTCPHRSDWSARWDEVGGWPPKTAGAIRSLGEEGKHFKMPPYVPMIQHGYSRKKALRWPCVAIPTFEIIRHRRNGNLYLRSKGASSVRQQFNIAPLTQMLMVSVDHDDPLEHYWQRRRKDNIPAQLSALDPMAITTPNYSFFSEAPRPHTLWNRTRIIRAAEELSAANLNVILHINAQTRADWEFWAEVLRAQPQIRYVTKEFQTGLHDYHKGKHALDQLAQLQQEIGRDIHPVLIGANQFAPYVASCFDNFTIVDSDAFMKTMMRQVLIRTKSGHWEWQFIPTKEGETLDLRLEHNIWQSNARLTGGASRTFRPR